MVEPVQIHFLQINVTHSYACSVTPSKREQWLKYFTVKEIFNKLFACTSTTSSRTLSIIFDHWGDKMKFSPENALSTLTSVAGRNMHSAISRRRRRGEGGVLGVVVSFHLLLSCHLLQWLPGKCGPCLSLSKVGTERDPSSAPPKDHLSAPDFWTCYSEAVTRSGGLGFRSGSMQRRGFQFWFI